MADRIKYSTWMGMKVNQRDIVYLTGFLRKRYGTDECLTIRTVQTERGPVDVASLTISCVVSDKLVENVLGKEYVNSQYHSQLIEVDLWGYAVDRIKKLTLNPNMMLGFMGELTVNEFNSKEGKPIRRFHLQANNFELRSTGQSSGGQPTQPAGTSSNQGYNPQAYESGFSDLSDDDVPFN